MGGKVDAKAKGHDAVPEPVMRTLSITTEDSRFKGEDRVTNEKKKNSFTFYQRQCSCKVSIHLMLRNSVCAAFPAARRNNSTHALIWH